MYVVCFIRQYVDIHKCTAAMLILVLGAVMSHAEQVGTDTYLHIYCRQLLHDRGRNVFFQDMIVLLSVSVNYLENLLFLKLP